MELKHNPINDAKAESVLARLHQQRSFSWTITNRLRPYLLSRTTFVKTQYFSSSPLRPFARRAPGHQTGND